MKVRLSAFAAFLVLALASCDDTTDTIGASLTDNTDRLSISTGTFDVLTRSIVADSVLSRNSIGYLGRIKDPETGAYITCDYTTQFHCLDDFNFPKQDSIVSRQSDGQIIADSCEIRLFYDNFYGDSLTTMKLSVLELAQPMAEGVSYYSNFNPETQGYVRAGGINKSRVYTLANKGDSDTERASSSYVRNIKVPLNQPYTDKDGVTYNNYGTYLLRKYYEDPTNYKDAYNFIHRVCPGFYFKSESGLGAMAYVAISQINIYYRLIYKDSIANTLIKFNGTEEVLQSTRVVNDRSSMTNLASDNSCTYLKSPAGIFTEMTLPVDEIVYNHDNDTINSAKIVLTRINNESHTGYELDVPPTLLLIPKDSLYTFFERGNLPNNKTSFLTSRDTKGSSSSQYANTYTFSNIANLVRAMWEAKQGGGANFVAEHPDWNKVVVVPVTATYTTQTSGYSTVQVITKVSHDMSLTSTRLVGGLGNERDKVTVSVIYSKFNSN